MSDFIELAANIVTLCGGVSGGAYVVYRFLRRVRITVLPDGEQ